MVRPAARRLRVRARALGRLLQATPGRGAFALRQAAICAVVAWVVAFYQTPEPALTVYVVFFLNAADRMTSLVMSVVELLLITAVIALVLLVTMFVIDLPLARVAAIAVLSFGLLFLASASKLRPIAPILALVAAYGLDLLGAFHSGEVATRLLLYAWLFAGIPAAVSIVASLLAAPPPRRLAERTLAGRLRLCAAMLGEPDVATRRAFAAALRDAPGKLPVWLKMAGLERSSPITDVAALGQAGASSVALMQQVDLFTRADGVALPATSRAALAQTLAAMAEIFDTGAYPLDVELPPPDARLTPLQSAAWTHVDRLLRDFAEPPPAEPAAAKAPHAKGGLLLPDAFINPVHVQYALKTTAAAMICYLLYQLLDWPGIHTCFLTCYIVALPTAAETVEKLALRIAGCLVGAAIGTLALVYLIPFTTSAGALMAVVFAGAFASAWIAAGPPAIAYAGFQVAFAFFLCVLQGAGPAFDLTIARDRVIGILLGNLVAYLVFTRWWPASVVRRIDPALGSLLRQLGGLLATPSAKRAAASTGIAASGGALARDLSLAGYEPWPLRPSASWLRARRRLLRRVLAATAPFALAADDSAATAWRQRLERASDRLDDAGVASSPSAVTVADDASGPLAEHALREIERSLPDPHDEPAGDTGHAHALA